MNKLFGLFFVVSILLLPGCVSRPSTSINLVPNQHYPMTRRGAPIFTAVATEGGLRSNTIDMYRRGSFRFYGNSGPLLSGVGFSTSIGIGSISETGLTYQLHQRKLRDFEQVIANWLSQNYTESFNKERQLTSVDGRVFYLKGFKCARVDEFQNYLAGISNAMSEILCPVSINGEVGAFRTFYRISVIAEKYKKIYGNEAMSLKELVAYHERLLEPIYDSIEFFQTVTQELPEQ